MDNRTPRYRARARAFRKALFAASGLVVLAGAALPLGISPTDGGPFQKAAQAKGGGSSGNSGAGGPPDHSNAGGNGGGSGHGGNLSSAEDGEDDDDGEPHGKNKLGKLNAANAADAAFIHASANSTVGQIAIYKRKVEDEEITEFEDAKGFLETFANKLVTEGVVATLNELLGLGAFGDEPGETDPEE